MINKSAEMREFRIQRLFLEGLEKATATRSGPVIHKKVAATFSPQSPRARTKYAPMYDHPLGENLRRDHVGHRRVLYLGPTIRSRPAPPSTRWLVRCEFSIAAILLVSTAHASNPEFPGCRGSIDLNNTKYLILGYRNLDHTVCSVTFEHGELYTGTKFSIIMGPQY